MIQATIYAVSLALLAVTCTTYIYANFNGYNKGWDEGYDAGHGDGYKAGIDDAKRGIS